jgi:hypothetical protein
MATLQCTNDQLKLIQTALDFYSRVGIGQFTEIKNHPTFEQSVYYNCSPYKKLEVGDHTMRGEITKITKAAIWTKGRWSGQEEVKKWTDIENVKLSPDWEKYHRLRGDVDKQLNVARNLLIGDNIGVNGSWGIYHSRVDESCRIAFSIIEKIRHQFWLANPNRSNMTVDSTDGRSNVKVEIDLED